jgi:hypothetical protein
MWLAHELNVLTAICTPIKTGGEKERVHSSNKKLAYKNPKTVQFVF